MHLLKLIFVIFLHLSNIQTSYAEIATGNNQFGFKLYYALASETEGDFIISPLPLSTLFASIYAQVSGGFRQDIQNIFQFSTDPSDTIRDYKRVLRGFEELDALKNIQSAILLNDSLNLHEQFETLLNSLNITTISSANEEILQWLDHPLSNDTTKSLELLQDSLEDSSNLSLLTKSFFQASWISQFNPLLTKPSPFFTNETRSVQVDMMFQRAQVPYAEIPELDCTAIALPYNTKDTTNQTTNATLNNFNRLELIFLLPNSRMGLSMLENKLKNFPFSLITRQFLEVKDLDVYIPRFNISEMINLTGIMSQELGIQAMRNLFNKGNTTDADDVNFKLGNILQFAEFSVDEAGSDGVTVPVPSNILFHNSPPSFRVNRPFIGVLYDQERHIILNIFRKTG